MELPPEDRREASFAAMNAIGVMTTQFVATVFVAGTALSAFNVFALDRFDGKFGGPWGSFFFDTQVVVLLSLLLSVGCAFAATLLRTRLARLSVNGRRLSAIIAGLVTLGISATGFVAIAIGYFADGLVALALGFSFTSLVLSLATIMAVERLGHYNASE